MYYTLKVFISLLIIDYRQSLRALSQMWKLDINHAGAMAVWA